MKTEHLGSALGSMHEEEEANRGSAVEPSSSLSLFLSLSLSIHPNTLSRAGGGVPFFKGRGVLAVQLRAGEEEEVTTFSRSCLSDMLGDDRMEFPEVDAVIKAIKADASNITS